MPSKDFEEFLEEVEAYNEGDLHDSLRFLEQTELFDEGLLDEMRIRAHREDDMRTDRYPLGDEGSFEEEYPQEELNHLYSIFDNRNVLQQHAGVSESFFKEDAGRIEKGILMDHNLLIGPADKTTWSVTASLDPEEFGKLIDRGLIPDEENHDLEDNTYTYRNKFTWEKVFDVMSLADEKGFQIAYPDNLFDVMERNGYPEPLISEYEDWLPSAAVPVPLSDYSGYSLEDAQVAAAAEARDLTVVSGDADFPQRIGEISEINPSVQSLDQAYWDLKGR